MRLLFLTCMPHAVTLGGANRAIRLLAIRLGHAGHCVTVAGPLAGTGPGSLTEQQGALWIRRHSFCEISPGYLKIRLEAHDYLTSRNSRLSPIAEFALRSDEWDGVLVAGEDMTGELLSVALSICPTRTVVLAQTPNLLPWGEESYLPNGPLASLLPQAAGVVACSRYLANLISSFGVAAHACYLPIFAVPRMRLGRWDSPFVSMINPCKAKGIDLFVRLAAERPNFAFCAVPLWGTTSEDRQLLTSANVHIVGPFNHPNLVWQLTRLLLVPSTWLENFSLSVIEAMLHGIPVFVSDRGGLPEASLGAAVILPAMHGVVPEGDVLSKWASTLDELLDDRRQYESVSTASLNAASRFARNARVETFINTLLSILR